MALEWHGDEIRQLVVTAVTDSLNEFGLQVEGEAKAELYPGHGKLTATLQRSIHAADTSYEYAADDVPPSDSSPDRGGSGGGATVNGNVVAIRVGSGMRYARRIEELYGYLEESWLRVLQRLPDILQKYAGQVGLRR